MNKSRALAFMLAFIPGFGHIYLQRKVRGALYAFGFAGSVGLAFASIFISLYIHDLVYFFAFVALGIWILNMMDMLITLLSGAGSASDHKIDPQTNVDDEQQERFFTIVLSTVPGVGHFHLGLNFRGLTFLVAFFGLATMILFVVFLTGQGGFLIFTLGLPIIWIYSLFDTIQLLNRKHKGEELVDQSVFDDMEMYKENGKKSKAITTVLAIFPGAGHMYLGLQQRGLQFMIGFVVSIYILDILRLSFFLFVIPIIWFYSFFDALQQQAKYEQGEAKDVPVFKYFTNQRRWLGAAMIIIGIFFIIDSILVPAFADDLYKVFGIDITYYYHRYLQIGIVSIILLVAGFRLLISSNKKNAPAGSIKE
jgi:hypothetical protein